MSINLDLVDQLQQIASGQARSIAQLAIAWTTRRPEVTSAIVGARSPSQIEGTAPAGDWTLNDELVAAIDGCLAQRKARLAELGPIDSGRV